MHLAGNAPHETGRIPPRKGDNGFTLGDILEFGVEGRD
jgi:hypothetical protein